MHISSLAELGERFSGWIRQRQRVLPQQELTESEQWEEEQWQMFEDPGLGTLRTQGDVGPSSSGLRAWNKERAGLIDSQGQSVVHTNDRA